MGCNGQSAAAADDNVAIPMTMAPQAYNKNWPTITYFEVYERGSAIHFQFEHAGQSYNEDLMKDWGKRKKDFGGNGLPVVTLPDGMQLAESVPTSIYYGKLFGQYPRDPLEGHKMELCLAKYYEVFNAVAGASYSKEGKEEK